MKRNVKGKRLLPSFLVSLTGILLFYHQPVFVQGIWKTYTTEDGLVSNIVSVITSDQLGNLWFGAWRGVSKFDGENWTTYLDSVWIEDITVDKDNNKWFACGTLDGPLVIQFDDITFSYYEPSNSWADIYLSICNDSFNNIWVGTESSYAYWFDGKEWTLFYVWGTLPYDGICVITMDREGTLWFGHGNGVSTIERWFGLWEHEVWDMAFDKNGNMWCGTQSPRGGVFRYDGQTWTEFREEDGLIYDWVSAVAVDSSNNVWFGTSHGVSRFNGESWTSFTEEDGLIRNAVSDIFVDSTGAAWFATWEGVSVYTDTTTTAIENSNIEDTETPQRFMFSQNYPNPFNPITTIHYTLPDERSKMQEAGNDMPIHTTLKVFNLLGQEVRTLVDEPQDAGYYTVTWNGRDGSGNEVSSGVYFYRLTVGDFYATKRMVLLK